MKLTNPESIQASEKEFIDAINAELDWAVLEKILIEKYQFAILDEVNYKNGNLIVHNNEIAYKFDFELKVPLSVVFNRQGECLDVSTLGDRADLPDNGDLLPQEPVKPPKRDKIGQMASDIADMISEINEA